MPGKSPLMMCLRGQTFPCPRAHTGHWPHGIFGSITTRIPPARPNTGDLRPKDSNCRSDGGKRRRGREGRRSFAREVAHLPFDDPRILAWASWWQPFGVELLQEVVAKRGNASGQVR